MHEFTTPDPWQILLTRLYQSLAPASITMPLPLLVKFKDEVDRMLAQIGCPEIGQLSLDFVTADAADLVTWRCLPNFVASQSFDTSRSG